MEKPLLLTSIGPHDTANQRLALSSWAAAGFEIWSCNTDGEIDALAPLFPDVRFIQLTRDAKGTYGKPFPYVADMVEILLQSGRDFLGLINSDIHLRNFTAPVLEEIFALTEENLVIFHRYDAESLTEGPGEYYRVGIDLFLFRQRFLKSYQDCGLVFGRPEWDHYMLHCALADGLGVVEIKNPAAFHLSHPQRWSAQESNRLVKQIADSGARDYPDMVNRYTSDLKNGRYLGSMGAPSKAALEHAGDDGVFWDPDCECMAAELLERYGCDAVRFPLGLGYRWEGRFYRIGMASKPLREAFSHCNVIKKRSASGGKTVNAGVPLAYIDIGGLEQIQALRRFYLYPAGRAARLLLDCLVRLGKPPLGVVDGDPRLAGTKISKFSVSSSRVLERLEEYDEILVVSNLYAAEIVNSLRDRFPSKAVVLI